MNTNTEILNICEIGAISKVGPKMNAEIHSLLNLTTAVPDYCNNFDLTAEYMKFNNRVPYIKPTPEGKRICVFDHDGTVCVTRPAKKGSQALAFALLFVLRSDKSQLTCQEE